MEIAREVTAAALGLSPREGHTLPAAQPTDSSASGRALETLEAEAELVIKSCRILSAQGVIFAPSPEATPYDPPLDVLSVGNQAFLRLERQASLLESRLAEFDISGCSEDVSIRHAVALAEVREAALEVLYKKRAEWDRQGAVRTQAESGGHRVVSCGKALYSAILAHPHTFLLERWSPRLKGRSGSTILAASLIVVGFSLLLYGTRGESNFWLGAMQVIINTALLEKLPSFDTSQSPILPRNIHTAFAMFDLDPITTPYVCCPECSALYSINADGVFPETCEWEEFGDFQCGEPLGDWKERSGGKSAFKPRRIYDHQSVVDWWGRMMSKPGIEAAADSYPRQNKFEEEAGDIWNAKRLRRMVFKDGKTCVGASGDSVGRYVFSFGIDWFTAHGSRAGKKAYSIGAVYLVCQNLPLSIRFLDENVCMVGIIPGPHKPGGDTLNRFLDKLVDDLEVLNDGVHYTKTHDYPSGRLVYGMLGPVIADLDACRAVGGCSRASHTYFCSFCRLKRRDITNLVPSTWPARSKEDHERFAAEWKSAMDADTRRAIYDKHGVFWTPLMRLKYWDPTRDLVLDPMHNLFIGFVGSHCREVWGMDAEREGGDGTGWVLRSQDVPRKWDLAMARLALRSPNLTENQLRNDNTKNVLRALCIELKLVDGMGPNPVKDDMVKALLQWVHASDFFDFHAQVLITFTCILEAGKLGSTERPHDVQRQAFTGVRQELLAHPGSHRPSSAMLRTRHRP